MSRFDIVNDISAVTSLPPASRTANATVNGTGVDLANVNAAAIIVTTGTITDGSHAITIEDSADNSNWTAVAADERIGNLPTVVAADDNTAFKFGYKGARRYLRVSVTTSGSTSGGVFGAVVVRGKPRRYPA
ncbi:hypothetical protein OHA25_08545 [Nonomuraea sp. NBC_00507]|uniref:hypothetical protein n=1 Tax=Nonomuraea sp. NBC_00507 TaxID=2976002 RepID=UPI002E196444